MLKPAPEYVSKFKGVQRKFDFCVRAAAVLSEQPAAPLELAAAHMLQPGVPNTSNVMYTLPELRLEAEYVVRQLAAWSRVRLRT